MIDLDWKKKAHAEAVDTKAVENSFMTQSYGYVANQARPLFKDPFRLGFEIVHRNTRATKMVGIYAFRVGGDILYVPVFFINGAIKGADLLYRGNVKQFVPCSEDWCKYLITESDRPEGSGIDRQEGPAARPINSGLQQLAHPNGVKSASVEEGTAAWGALLDTMTDIPEEPVERVLPNVLADGGRDTFEKFASLLEEHHESVARKVVEDYSAEELTPVAVWDAQESEMAKKASLEDQKNDFDKVTSGVVKFHDVVHGVTNDDENQKIQSKGFALRDNRKVEHNVVEYGEDSDFSETAEVASGTGVFSVYKKTSSGSVSVDKVVVVRDVEYCRSGDYDIDDTVLRMVDKGGKIARIATNSPIATRLDEEDLDSITKPISSVKVGKSYLVINPGTLEAFSTGVIEGIDKGEVTELRSKFGNGDTLIKKDATDCCMHKRHINDSFRVIEKDGDCYHGMHSDNHPYITLDNIEEWYNGHQSKGKTKMAMTVAESALDGRFDLISDGEVVNRDVTGEFVVCKLATALDLKVRDAEEIVEKAASREKLDFTVVLPEEGPVSKSAYFTRLVDAENFTTDYDSDHGVEVDTPQAELLRTETPNTGDLEQGRIGDVVRHNTENEDADGDFTMSDEDVRTLSPEEMAAKSTALDMPHVFDHGMVGALAEKTYDAISQVEDYIPKMQSGLDRIGRTLFLLRYKPTDFEDAYGADDMRSLEQEITSVFKSQGALVLRLLKRSKTRDRLSTQTT